MQLLGDACSLVGSKLSIASAQLTTAFTVISDKSSSGRLCINEPLDYESRDTYELRVIASSASGVVLASTVVKVTVDDVNDNDPVFERSVYVVKVVSPGLQQLSNESAVTEVAVVRATDADRGVCGTVFYALVSGNDEGLFTLHQRTGVLSCSTDAFHRDNNTRHYQLFVAAYDGCHGSVPHYNDSSTSSVARVFVTVTGSNGFLSFDVPRPRQLLYQFTIPETVLPGHVIGRIKVDDYPPEWEHAYDYIMDENNTTSSMFSINNSTGLITTSKAFDHKATSFTIFTVSALFTTNQSAIPVNWIVSAQVLVNIVQDNVPLFPIASVQLSVREDSPISTLIYVASAIHLDNTSPQASPVAYSISNSSGDADKFFDVDRWTGRVRLRGRLDRELVPFHRLSLIASTNGAATSNHLELSILVHDANDNSPVFDRSVYSCEIVVQPMPSTMDMMHTRPRCVVHAADADEGPAATLAYYFVFSDANDDEDDQEFFEIDSATGEVSWSSFVLNGSVRIQCSPKTYHLLVGVQDGGVSPRKSVSPAVVIVTPLGGPCSPIMTGDDDVIHLTVSENLPTNSKVGSLTLMTHYGEPFQQRILRYYMVDDDRLGSEEDEDRVHAKERFEVDEKTGQVFTKEVLDREEFNKYEFRVVVVMTGDKNEDWSVSFNVSRGVVVHVVDSNDNCPTFHNVNNDACFVELTVIRNQPSGSIVTILSAMDPDDAENGTISYSLLTDSDTERCRGAFDLDTQNGCLTMTSHGTLISRLIQYCTLKVVASDQGRPQCQTVQLILIHVIQDNEDGHVTNSGLASQAIAYQVNDFSTPGTLVGLASQAIAYQVKDFSTPGTLVGLASEAIAYQVKDFSTPGTLVGLLSSLDVVRKVAERHSELIKSSKSEGLDDNTKRRRGTVYKLIRGNVMDSFVLDPMTGMLYTARPINHVHCPTYQLTVDVMCFADDLDNPLPSYGRIEVTVDVEESAGQLVDFEGWSRTNTSSLVSISLRENSPIGSVIFLAGLSSGSPTKTGSWSYLIVAQNCTSGSSEDTHCDAFVVDPENGHVILDSELDAEQGWKRIVVVIGATTKGGKTSTTLLTLIVNVQDVNDNEPMFAKHFRFRSVKLDENATVGLELLRLLATDKDSSTDNSRLTYRILDGNEHNRFHVDSTSGSLTLAGSLDYEQLNVYRLRVIAQDGGCPRLEATSTVVIRVDNINDNKPLFDQPRYEVFLSENVPPGTAVVQLNAIDADLAKDINNRTYDFLRFKMAPEPEVQKAFTLDQSTGLLTTVTSFDRELRDKYIIIALVTDGLYYDVTEITINIEDVNDYTPSFYRKQYSVDVIDDGEAGVDELLLTVFAEDRDVGSNGNVSYWISGGNADGMFYLDPLTGSLFINHMERFRWRRRTNLSGDDVQPIFLHNLTVTAVDSGVPSFSSSVQVQLRINCTARYQQTMSRGKFQTNDGFQQVNTDGVKYVAMIAEDVKVGTEVLTVKYSKDTAECGTVKNNSSRLCTSVDDVVYSFALDADVEGRFVIDRNTGAIKVARRLDYETRSIYSFLVLASRDLHLTPPTMQFLDSAEVEINVSDVDECRAVFEQPVYRVMIPASSAVGHQVVNVKAVDAVCGRPVSYSVLDKLTYIDINSTTGAVYIRKSFAQRPDASSFKAFFRVSVNARTTGAVLFIQLSDPSSSSITSHQLRFSSEEYDVTVSERSRPSAGTPLITVSAHWTSGGSAILDDRIVHQFIDGIERDCFVIDPKSGELSLTNSSCLQFSSTSHQHYLVVAAVSRDSIAVASVKVTHQPIQEQGLEFPADLVEVLVAEDLPRNSTVATLRAWYPNRTCGGSLVRYDISNHRNEFAVYRSVDGGATLRTNVELDRETRASYRLQVRATTVDRCGIGTVSPKRHSADTTIVVTVTDINDHSPFIPAFGRPARIREDAYPGSPVVQVKATDVDLNAILAYSFTHGNHASSFHMDWRTGQITNAKPLSGPSTYCLGVQVTDGVHVANGNVTVQVESVRNKRPQFQKSFYQAVIEQSTEAGAFLLQVSADCQQPYCVTYRLQPSVSGFAIDPLNGSIYTTQPLMTSLNSNDLYLFLTVIASNAVAVDHVTMTSSAVVLIDIRVNGADDQTRTIPERLAVEFTCASPDAAEDADADDAPEEAVRVVQSSSTLAEDAKSDTIVFQPTGNDFAVNVTNQHHFDIVSGNDDDLFVINRSTGCVTLRHSLDYERTRRHRIVVRASPQGVSTVSRQLFAISVDVDDVNEFHPRFALPVYRTVTVVDNQAEVEQDGGILVTSVRANDGDGGQYGAVEYHLEKEASIDVKNPIRISVDRLSGDVKLVSASFPPEIAALNFTVVAADKGGWTDSARVSVRLVYRRQAATSSGQFRRFARDQYEFRVTGSSHLSHVIGEVGLVDERGQRVLDDDVNYFVVNSNGSSTVFHLNATNGFIVYVSDDVTRQSNSQSSVADDVILLNVIAQHKTLRGRPSLAETVVVIRIDRSISAVQQPSMSRSNTEIKVVLIAIISSFIVVSLVIVIVAVVHCRRRPPRHIKSASSHGFASVDPSLSVSRKPATLPIPPPPNYPPDETIPMAHRYVNGGDPWRPIIQRGTMFTRRDVITTGKGTMTSSSSSLSSSSFFDDTVGTRLDDFFYDDGASDSGMIDDDGVPVPPPMSGVRVDGVLDLANDRPVKRKPCQSGDDRRIKDNRKSITSGRWPSTNMTSLVEESDEYSNNVEHIYTTIVSDVEDAVENYFRFIAVNGRSDLMSLADKQSVFEQLLPVFAEVARLEDGDSPHSEMMSPSSGSGHVQRRSIGANGFPSIAKFSADSNGLLATPSRLATSRHYHGDERLQSSPPVITNAVIGPPGRMLQRPLPVNARRHENASSLGVADSTWRV